MEAAQASIDIDTLVDSRAKELRAVIDEIKDKLRWLPRARAALIRLNKCASIGDVDPGRVTLAGWAEKPTIYLYLRKDRPASTLVREIVREFSLKVNKRQSTWGGGTLSASGETPDGVEIVIEGYRPSTCRVVYEEVTEPARTRTVARVVCDDEEAP